MKNHERRKGKPKGYRRTYLMCVWLRVGRDVSVVEGGAGNLEEADERDKIK